MSATNAVHPAQVLLGAQAGAMTLPVCDHYSGVEARMRKSLQLQAEMIEEFGACVFDVTLDCEDGAPVGGESEHAAMVVALAALAGDKARVAVRVHAVDHPAFDADMAVIAGKLARHLSHIMVPKVESLADVLRAEQALLAAAAGDLPLHVLIESPLAVRNAFEIAAHPRVQSLSFGLMDFVSAHARRDSRRRHEQPGPVHASAGAARQAGNSVGLPRPRQGALTLCCHGIQRH